MFPVLGITVCPRIVFFLITPESIYITGRSRLALYETRSSTVKIIFPDAGVLAFYLHFFFHSGTCRWPSGSSTSSHETEQVDVAFRNAFYPQQGSDASVVYYVRCVGARFELSALPVRLRKVCVLVKLRGKIDNKFLIDRILFAQIKFVPES